MKNPFELVTASKLTAEDAVELWCDDKRLDRVKGRENCFVNGHRGTGKSMLFRIMQHDCQKLLNPNSAYEFLAVYFSVRDTEFVTEELDLFQSDAQKNLISESHFSLLILKQLFLLILHDNAILAEKFRPNFMKLVTSCLSTVYRFSTETQPTVELDENFSTWVQRITSVIEEERARIVHYIGLRLYSFTPFSGPLFLFDAFLAEVGDFILNETGRALYVLVDDGDDLPESHTIVLNSWIARRRSSIVFKVSTMFGYKTYETRSRSAIQHPHDFFQYDIATRYLTDSAEDYVKLLRDICAKRLQIAGIETAPGKHDPEQFFPVDTAQVQKLQEIAKRLEPEYMEKYTGRAIRDYLYRHLTSEYIQELAQKRSPETFTYAGFITLATLSSGLVRDFIICAQRMFDAASRRTDVVSSIHPSIQNVIVREHANLVLEEIRNFRQKRSRDSTREDWERIYKLIEALGNLYKSKMMSKDAERRVFSFAFQTEPGPQIERLLDLAVSEGYLMRGFISRKEGTGRRTLYVLTRRLAPAFNLDVSAYSGYLSLTAERVESFMKEGANRVSSGNPDQMFLFGSESIENDASVGTWVMISPEEAGR